MEYVAEIVVRIAFSANTETGADMIAKSIAKEIYDNPPSMYIYETEYKIETLKEDKVK